MPYHPEFNFEDGNIVLRVLIDSQTPSTSPHYISFRVHKSILRMQSEVFDGMMDLPQPPTKDGSSDDQIPVVDMLDDATELIAVLTLIYHPAKVLRSSSAQSVFDDIALALPVIRKYQMDNLLRSCISRIQMDCPETLREWDMRNAKVGSLRATDGFPWVEHVVVEPAGIIALARRVPEIHSLVPVAFYDLSRADYTVDDTMALDHEFESVYTENGGIIVRRSLLTTEDLLILWRGANAMKSEIYRTAHNLESRLGLFQYDIPSNLNHAGCSQTLPGGLEKFISDILIDSIARPDTDPLAWMKIKANATYPENMCQMCLENGRRFLMGYRYYLWGELPKFFS